MLRSILMGALLVVALPASAAASGINLAWNDCLGGGGASSRSFACNTNVSGQSVNHHLFLSVRAPSGITAWTAFEAGIVLQSTGATLPRWWEVRGTGHCRDGSIGLTVDFTTNTGCTDPYLALGVSGFGPYELNYGAPNRARLRLLGAIPDASAQPLEAEREYYAARIVINNQKTVGGACTGCSEGVCLVAEYVLIYQVPETPGGNVNLTAPAESNVAVWQAGHPACPGATPAARRTWGAVKGLYR